MEFRLNGHHWHFSPNCPRWPRESFNAIRINKFPTSFKVCPGCTKDLVIFVTSIIAVSVATLIAYTYWLLLE